MKALLKLRPYLRPYRFYIWTSLILAFPLAALRAAPAPFIQKIIDDLLISKDPSRLVLYPLLFIGLYFVNFIVRFFHYYCLRVVVSRVHQNLKNDLFDHLMSLSADHFTQSSTGTLMSRVSLDPQHVDGGVAQINVLIREPLQFLLLLSYTLYLNWKLTILTFLIFPPLAWVFRVTGKNLKRYIQRMQEQNAEIYSTLQESFTGVRVVQMFRLEEYVIRKFRERSETFIRFLLKTAVLEESSHPMVELITAFAIALLLYVGGQNVISGEMRQGELLAFFAAFALMMNPIRTMNDMNMKLHAASAACQRIFEIFEWKSTLLEHSDPKKKESFDAEIEFRDVHFAYPDEPAREILKGISFRVPKNRTVALVGASGAGKSSLVTLLPRIFDVTGGTIFLDGNDIREIELSSLRRMISVVSQDVFLFNDTIEENIRCGRLEATSEEIFDAAKHAYAWDFIQKLPQGMSTKIGDRGQKLSGGERQRLSIARAFLRGSPILILDEATSSLDSASERAVQQALQELMQNRTTIVIAHRLSTIRNANEILVLDGGLIVEQGTHSTLLEKNGAYARFLRQNEQEPPITA